MENQTINQRFANDFTEVAQLPNEDNTKHKLLRQAKRLQYQAQNPGIEFYEILLDEDREPAAFDSIGLYETINRFDVEDQKRLQFGVQLMNAYDQFSCGILIGGYAKAHYVNMRMELKPQMTYVMGSKYESLLKYCSTNNINTIVSPDKTFFEIPSHGAKIYDANTNLLFADIMSDMQWARIFSGKVALSSRPVLLEVN